MYDYYVLSYTSEIVVEHKSNNDKIKQINTN